MLCIPKTPIHDRIVFSGCSASLNLIKYAQITAPILFIPFVYIAHTIVSHFYTLCRSIYTLSVVSYCRIYQTSIKVVMRMYM